MFLAVICPPPPKFPNTKIKQINSTSQSVYYFGNLATYECVEGYRMYGNDGIRCMANGRWNRMQGKCISKQMHLFTKGLLFLTTFSLEISCKRPNVHSKTKIEGNSYLFEDQVALTCSNNKKYILVCAANEEWIGERDTSC